MHAEGGAVYAPLPEPEPGLVEHPFEWSSRVVGGVLVVFVLICIAHVLMYGGGGAWPSAATISIRAFASAVALTGASLAWARYAARGSPLMFLLGSALASAGLFMMLRVVVTILGHTDPSRAHLFAVSLRSAWAQDTVFLVILLGGIALLPPRGAEWREPWRLVTATALAVTATAVGLVGPWWSAFPGQPRPDLLVARPDFAWSAALNLVVLMVLWQRDDVRSTVEGRWLAFALVVSFLNQVLVLPFWPPEAAAAASALGSAVNAVVYALITTGLLVGTFASARDARERVARVRQLEAERDRTERALARYAARLERANEELGEFAYVASHDLQEPLRMVTSYLQLIERRYAELVDDDGKEFIRHAVDGATRMKRLTEDLLAYSRASGVPLEAERTELDDALRSALGNLALAIAESGAVIAAEPLPALDVDRTQMVQLFQNLVGNALKFRRPGVAPRVHVMSRRTGSEWVVSVRDEGIGLDPRYAEKVFAIFQRLQPHDGTAGTGIGLALCRKIVERHGGRIWYERAPLGGTVFHVALPVGRRAAPAADDAREDPVLREKVNTLVERARELI
jgi:signal transduction histidine kinase